MKNLGFIGLGNMGKGMASNLVSNNYNVTGYDLNHDAVKDLSKNNNFIVARNIQEVVSSSDIILTMLPDGKTVKNVWNEIIEFSSNNKILVDCSTIDVKTSLEVQKQAHSKNLLTLDAPVSGGVMGANDGSLTFMVGGEEKTYKQIKNLLDIMGKKTILCGSYGAGQSAKICNNMLLASTMIAVGESFNLAKNLKLNPEKLFEVLSTSSGSCWAINNYCPYKDIGPISPADNDFEGGFSTALMNKDLTLAVSAAEETKTEICFGLQSQKKFQELVHDKKGHLDFSYIVTKN